MTGKICPIMSARVFDDDGGPEMVYCTPSHCAWGVEMDPDVWVSCAHRRFLRSSL